MSDTSLPIGNAYARAQLTALQLQERTGLSLRELAEMDLSDYARLAYGQTPTEAAIAAYNAEQDAKYQRTQAPQQAPAAPQSAPQPPAPEYQSVDVNSLSMGEYAALRGQLGVGGKEYGRGIMNSDSGTDAWVQAARAKSGRHGWNGSNVEEAPRIEGRFVNHDEHRDTRSLQERFNTYGNAFGA